MAFENNNEREEAPVRKELPAEEEKYVCSAARTTSLTTRM